MSSSKSSDKKKGTSASSSGKTKVSSEKGKKDTKKHHKSAETSDEEQDMATVTEASSSEEEESNSSKKGKKNAKSKKDATGGNTSDNDEPAKDKGKKDKRLSRTDKICKLFISATKIKRKMEAYWDGKLQKGEVRPTLRGNLHAYMAGYLQDLAVKIIDKTLPHVQKNSHGVYIMALINLQGVILTDSDLSPMLKAYVNEFKGSDHDINTCVINGRDMTTILQETDKKCEFGDKGKDLITYLLHRVFTAGMNGLVCSKKWVVQKGVNSIAPKHLNAVLSTLYPCDLQDALMKKAMSRLETLHEHDEEKNQKSTSKDKKKSKEKKSSKSSDDDSSDNSDDTKNSSDDESDRKGKRSSSDSKKDHGSKKSKALDVSDSEDETDANTTEAEEDSDNNSSSKGKDKKKNKSKRS
jgi:hypothetical protein